MTDRAPNCARSGAASDGFIIVAVLWILGALATLISIYAIYVIDTAAAFSLHDDRVRAQALVSGAIELAAYQLTAPIPTRPNQGRFGFRMGPENVAVEFRSEAARIDLNAAPKELLVGLFVVLGARRDHAENYANHVINWRTAPAKDRDWEEASAYRAAGLSYAPRGAKFPHVGELSLVLDLPTNLVERALPFVTVYSGRSKINVLSAAPEVIAALPGMTRDRLNAVLAQRKAVPGNGSALLALMGPAQEFSTIEASRASRVTVRVALANGRKISAEVVILISEEDEQPFSVLWWGDELEESRNDDAPRAGLR
jgi:general secretion pathway protein K